ncbi:MAG: large conductance mechanosensitive channel protein MscL [Gammaproteobacteria bacterium]
MIDMAVGIVIGVAFGKVVESLVKDVIMPPIGMLLGGVNFSQLHVNLGSQAFSSLEAAEQAGAPLLKYGSFINTLVDFFIVVLVIFMVIKGINKMKAMRGG